MGIGDSPSKSDYLRWQSSHYTSRHVNWIRVRSPFRRRDATLHPLPPRHINPTIILSTWWVASPRHINTSNQFNWRSNGRFPYILLLFYSLPNAEWPFSGAWTEPEYQWAFIERDWDGFPLVWELIFIQKPLQLKTIIRLHSYRR